MLMDFFFGTMAQAKAVLTVAAAYVFAYVRIYPWLTVEPDEWHIHKVLAFSDDPEHAAHDFEVITAWMDPTCDITDVMAELLPDWKAWRVEVRYTRNKTDKFRAVLRPGDTFTWPPPDRCQQPRFHAIKRPSGILSAHLVPLPGIDGAKELNITARLSKYDRTSTTLMAHDIFPMDDTAYVAERFGSIRIIAMRDTVAMETVDFAANAEIKICAKP